MEITLGTRPKICLRFNCFISMYQFVLQSFEVVGGCRPLLEIVDNSISTECSGVIDI